VLRDLVKRGTLKTPVQRDFDEAAWDTAFAAIAEPSIDDRRLHASARFFAHQLAALRRTLSAHPPPQGTPTDRIRRAVGLVNREYLTVAQTVDARPIATSVHDVIQTEVSLRGGNTVGAAQLVETIVDALRFELDALRTTASGQRTDDSDALRVLSVRLNLAVFYHILEEQWLDCLLRGWAVLEQESNTAIVPLDTAAATDYVVGEYREQALIVELMARSEPLVRQFVEERELRGVARQRGRRRHIEYDTVVVSRKVAQHVALGRVIAGEPDLRPHLAMPIDSHTGLTCFDMLNIWSALAPLADADAANMPVDRSITRLNEIEQCAPQHDLRTLAPALSRCTGVHIVRVRRALELLTWRTSRDSLWQRPFVPLDNMGKVAIVVAALSLPNLRRSIEYWLSSGTVDLSVRGQPFEQYVRDELREDVASNARLRTCRVRRDPATPDDRSVGDIDLLVGVGAAVLVGEVKCLVRPATSYEWFQFEDRIAEAVVQAQRKAAYVARNVPWVSRQGVHDGERVASIVPCVVINSALGALRVVDNVAVVDAYILHRFFGAGYGSEPSTLKAEADAPRVYFYADDEEAGAKLEPFLNSPDHLRSFRESIQMDTRPQPDFVDLSRYVVYVYPVVRVRSPSNE
jgi:hypothetical protein